MKFLKPALSRNLVKEDIPDALAVSYEELGSDYLSEKDFSETIESDSAFCKAVTYDGQFAGFAICQVFGPDNVDDMLRLPDSPERDYFLSKDRIGLFDSTAIRKDLQGLGIGTEIAMACYDKFVSKRTDVICAMAWKRVYGTINVEGVLRKMGMTPYLEILGYWNRMVDSRGGHDCPVCGRPCKCSAVLYRREM
ncbi:MAG: hypothetical protein LBH88_03395 [Candidatus Methanoplasma sp.]|jgi:GNAT superfamily N-acetyltransferase|nr:hypothetical protein [Candidatus Methanoplasma sp.]